MKDSMHSIFAKDSIFAKNKIIPFTIGLIFTYPLIVLIISLLEEPKTVLLAGIFVGVVCTTISYAMERASGYFFISHNRYREPSLYWFWMGHYSGFIFWPLTFFTTQISNYLLKISSLLITFL